MTSIIVIRNKATNLRVSNLLKYLSAVHKEIEHLKSPWPFRLSNPELKDYFLFQ